ncbi:DUF4476 domain-containing protein [Myxococcus sp. K15C18031901]|uniref:DUF4476 domain-containing protein n=1 Tax=Myxococcus dinghuensis TaxID=2906761 RepID=UPI0020A72194|nr:DUF4476 domain-containing protein [Myxococcus dinghuensis]MCP3098910.1 DUF4476 domain-containing protein [Myxococcus dinghuensis]
MKALVVAVALLSAASSFAQDSANEKFRGPPPGRPVPQQPAPPTSGPFVPPNQTGTLVVVNRDELASRIERLERLLADIEDRADRDTRAKARRAQEQLDGVRRAVGEAPLLANVMPRPQPPPPPPAIRPMSDSAFQRVIDAMNRETFKEDKMRMLTMGLNDNYLLVSQVSRIINMFQFADDKLAAVQVVRNRILDTDNNYLLFNSFTFSQDKKKLQEILTQR